MSDIRDRLQRPLRDLRVSVTDRCNLRCRYCMPRELFGPGYEFLSRSQLLDFDEIVRVARACARHGATKVRLTGGEPLLRSQLERLVAMLVRVDGIEEIALTTNGLLLAPRAQSLADAGLTRVTVSLDALDSQVIARIGGAPVQPQRVLDGIAAAADAGLQPVKVNMVVRRGLNEHCVVAMAERFRGSGQILRFIEYMDVGSSNGWRREHVVPSAEILASLRRLWPLEPLAPRSAGEVARRYRYCDGAGEVGFVSSVSEPFCGQCTRARLSADGRLYTCLFATDGVDLRAPLREGADEDELASCVATAWGARRDRYSAERAPASRHIAREPAAVASELVDPASALADPRSPAGSATTAIAASQAVARRIEMSYIGG